MYYIKKIYFYLICIFAVQICNYSYLTAMVGKNAAVNGLTAVGDGIKDGLKGASKNVADGMRDSASTAAQSMQDTAKALAPVLDKVGPAVQLASVAYTAGQAWNIGKDVKNGACAIKSYYYPNQEQKTHAARIEKEYTFLTTEKAFKQCLLKNVNSNRSSSGLPAICNETARMFAMAAGNKAANEITETFKQYFNEPKK